MKNYFIIIPTSENLQFCNFDLVFLPKNEEENIQATFFFLQVDSQIGISGEFNFFDEKRTFRLESCDTLEKEDCYLWMEVQHQER